MSREKVNEEIHQQRLKEKYTFDNSETPLSFPNKPDVTSPETRLVQAKTVSKDKGSPLYPNEWITIKEFRKSFLEQIKILKTCVSSWKKPEDYDQTLSVFNEILENTLHITNSSSIYTELTDAFIDMLEHTATLVDYSSNGVGINPLSLQINLNNRVQNTQATIRNKLLELSRTGYLDRWYAWAAQWWLKDEHAAWFINMAKMSRSDDGSDIRRKTEIMLIDESSVGASRYCKYGLVSLNYPSLRYVNVMRNKDPWWFPPEIIDNTISVQCRVRIDYIKSKKTS